MVFVQDKGYMRTPIFLNSFIEGDLSYYDTGTVPIRLDLDLDLDSRFLDREFLYTLQS